MKEPFRVKNKTIEDLANIFTDKTRLSKALLEKLAKINPGSEEAQKNCKKYTVHTPTTLKTQEERDREAYIENLQSGSAQQQEAPPR